MKLPTRLAAALGALATAATVLVQETPWSHELKLAITGVLVAGAAWVIHPEEGGVKPPPPGI